MKTSFISTVLNEEGSIGILLESVFSQSLVPDEIIIVDGGSTDTTYKIIKKKFEKVKKYEKFKKISFKLIKKFGNRSVGRNEAVRNSLYEIILCTDAGCELDANWSKRITEPFRDPEVEVVAGYYSAKPENIFQKSLVPYVLVMPDRIDPDNFLPAGRSMAFRKSAWKHVGGFSESLSHNEDYVFSRRLRENGAKIIMAENAIAYWIPRENLKEAYTMFYRFAFGDAQAGILRPKVILIFLRYVLSFILCLLFFFTKNTIYIGLVAAGFILYAVWSILKNYRYVHDVKATVLLPAIQITSDIAIIFGSLAGWMRMKYRYEYKQN